MQLKVQQNRKQDENSTCGPFEHATTLFDANFLESGSSMQKCLTVTVIRDEPNDRTLPQTAGSPISYAALAQLLNAGNSREVDQEESNSDMSTTAVTDLISYPHEQTVKESFVDELSGDKSFADGLCSR